MTESEFASACSALLDTVEQALDAAEIDVDCERKSPTVLEIEFDNGSRMVVNGQAPMRQVWLAARSGGYHFAYADGVWRDTRSGESLGAALASAVAAQGDAEVTFAID